LLNFTIIKLSITLLIGIVLEFYFKIPVDILLPIGFLIFLIFICLYLRSRKLKFPDIFFGVSLFMMFLFLGVFTASLQLPYTHAKHYAHTLNKESNNLYTLTASVTELLKPTSNSERFIISATSLDRRKTKGKILLNLRKGINSKSLEVGDILLMPIQFQDIKAPLNPHQFSYKSYLERSGILKQANSEPEDVQIIGSTKFNIFRIAERSRKEIILKLEEANFTKNEFSIIKALLLGERRDISPTTFSNYASAGAIHILAISGLHIGILLWLLTMILKPIERIKFGKFYSFMIILIFLWTFALVTGLAPSVVRAVFMFSIIAVGIQFRRNTNITNSVFISLFFLLLINPYYIYQVGFQLSYLAILGITSIQPLLQKLWKPKNRVILYFWKLLSVSIAAQLAVLPLSFFYFHQFPTLFFVTNIVILPFLGIILGLGLVVIVLSLLDLLPAILISLFEFMILQMNNFVTFISSFQSFVIKDISFSIFLCLTTYLALFTFIQLILKWTPKRILTFLFSIIILQTSLIFEKVDTTPFKAVIFHSTEQSLIAIKKHQELVLYSPKEVDSSQLIMLSRFNSEESIISTERIALGNVLDIWDNKILIIDSSGIYDIPAFKPDIIILRNSPKINLDRVLEKLQPEVIVADGSNYKYLVQHWHKTLENKNSLFHATAEKGAYIFYPRENSLE